MDIRTFVDTFYTNYNSRTVAEAARAYEAHIQSGGKMLVTLAGAMSTARLGRHLARAIRADLVHAVCCTGANLEEDVFNLLEGDNYENIPNWRALSAEDDVALVNRGMNRVTDTCIPEHVMRHVQGRLERMWAEASEPQRPDHFMKRVAVGTTELHQRPTESWILAAAEKNIPVWTPGWEDSTTGNIFTSAVMRGVLKNHRAVQSGTEQMQSLMNWYLAECGGTGIGFFQVGGGIAGDFAICAVPCLIQDMELEDTPLWAYFAQISDAVTSYGGYSGAPPNEKITWGKLSVDTPKYMIESDATIVAPLIFSYLLGD